MRTCRKKSMRGNLGFLSSCSGLVAADDPAAAAARGDHVVRRAWSPRTLGVDLGVALGLPGSDERVDDLPRELDLLGAGKCRMPPGHHPPYPLLLPSGHPP